MQCGSQGRGIVDCTGFDGFAVCGTVWLRKFRERWPERCGEVRRKRQSELYRFGGGTGLAGLEVDVHLTFGGLEVVETVDVITGSLPLLLGRLFGAAHRFWCGIEEGEVWQRRGADFVLLGRSSKRGLMFLSLTGEVEATEFPLSAQVVATATVGESSAEAHETGAVEPRREAEGAQAVGGQPEAGGWKPWPRRRSVRTARGTQIAERAAAAEETPSERSTPQQEAAETDDAREAQSDTEREELTSDEVSEKPEAKMEKAGGAGQAAEARGARFEAGAAAGAAEARGVRFEAAATVAAEGDGRFAETAEDARGSEAELPKRLRLSDAQIKKAHERGHRSAASLMRFFRSTIPAKQRGRYAAGLEALRPRVEAIVAKCKGCGALQPHVPQGTKVPRSDLAYLDRAWVDVLVLDRALGYYSLGVIDDCTGDLALQFMQGHGASEVQDAYEERWASLRGLTNCVVTDRGRELLDATTVEYFDKQGTLKETTAAYDSDAHGRVERMFETIRWTLDRVCAKEGKPVSAAEWKRVLWSAENSARNEVLRGGFSSSQRAWGRGTSMSIDPCDASLATDGEAESQRVRRILELQEMAREAYQHARSSRALGQILREKVQPQARRFVVGEAVHYRRPLAPGSKKSNWKGPAVVAGVVPSLSGSSVQYQVSHGGVLHSCAANDLVGWRERRVGENRPLVLSEDVVQASKGVPERRAPEEADEEKRSGPQPKETAQAVNEDDELARVQAALAEEASKVKRPGRPPVRQAKPTKPKGVTVRAPRCRARGGKKAVKVKVPVPPNSKWALLHARWERVDAHVHSNPTPGHPTRTGQTNKTPLLVRDEDSSGDDDEDAAEGIDGGGAAEQDSAQQFGGPSESSPTGVDDDGDGAGAMMCDLAGDSDSDAGHGDFDRCMRTLLAFAAQKYPALHNDQHVTDAALADGDNQYEYTWDDVSPEEQQEARAQGLRDYDDHGCWETDPSEALTKAELVAFDPGAEILGAHWVDKSKLVERDGEIVLAGRSRWTPHGYDEHDPGSVDSPTPTQATLRMVHSRGMRQRRVKISFDLGSAFFFSKKKEQSHTWIKEPPELRRADGKVRYRKLYVDVPGTKRGPRSFYETLMDHLIKGGCVRSKVDRCLLFLHDADGNETGELVIHVDDGMAFVDEGVVEWLESYLSERFKVKFKIVGWSEPHEFTGYTCIETEEGTEMHQHKYVSAKVQPVQISKSRSKQVNSLISEEERSDMRAALGSLRWAHRTNLEIGYELHRASQWVTHELCTIERLNRLNKVIMYLRNGRREHDAPRDMAPVLSSLFIPRLSNDVGLKVVMIADAGDPPNDELYKGKWQGCYVVGLAEDTEPALMYAHCSHPRDQAKFCPIVWKMGSTRRVAGNSFDGESATFIEGLDVSLSIANQCEEAEFGIRPGLWERHLMGQSEDDEAHVVPIEGHTDSNDLVMASRSLVYPRGMEKRRKSDIADIQQLQCMNRLRDLVKIRGTTNPANAGTKKLSFEDITMTRLRTLQQGRYTPDY